MSIDDIDNRIYREARRLTLERERQATQEAERQLAEQKQVKRQAEQLARKQYQQRLAVDRLYQRECNWLAVEAAKSGREQRIKEDHQAKLEAEIKRRATIVAERQAAAHFRLERITKIQQEKENKQRQRAQAQESHLTQEKRAKALADKHAKESLETGMRVANQEKNDAIHDRKVNGKPESKIMHKQATANREFGSSQNLGLITSGISYKITSATDVSDTTCMEETLRQTAATAVVQTSEPLIEDQAGEYVIALTNISTVSIDTIRTVLKHLNSAKIIETTGEAGHIELTIRLSQPAPLFHKLSDISALYQISRSQKMILIDCKLVK